MARIIKATLMQYRGEEDESMQEQSKTPEQLRSELIEKIQSQGAEHLTEVAMPGVVQPVDPSKL